MFAHHLRCHLRVRIGFLLGFIARDLLLLRRNHPATYGRRIFRGRRSPQLFIFDGRHFDMNVDAIQQRPRNFRNVALDHWRRAVAFVAWIAKIPAGTWIRRRSQHEARWKSHRNRRARYSDRAIFQGLAHNLPHVALKFGQLVEKQYAVVA